MRCIFEVLQLSSQNKTNKMNRSEILSTELEFLQSDNLDNNRDKYGDTGNECECCGKPLKNFNNAINTLEGPSVIPANITDEMLDKAGLVSQGIFYLGSSCIKKYPVKYRIKFDDNGNII